MIDDHVHNTSLLYDSTLVLQDGISVDTPGSMFMNGNERDESHRVWEIIKKIEIRHSRGYWAPTVYFSFDFVYTIQRKEIVCAILRNSLRCVKAVSDASGEIPMRVK